MDSGGILLALGGRARGRTLGAGDAAGTGGLSVANRPLLEHAVTALARAGVSRLAIVTTPASTVPVREAVEGGLPDDLPVVHVEVPATASPDAAVLAGWRVLPGVPVVVHADDSLVLGELDDALRVFEQDPCDVLQVVAPALPLPPAPPSEAPVVLHARPRTIGVQVLGARAREILSAAGSGTGGETLEDLPRAVRDGGGRVVLHEEPCAWRYAGDVESYLEVNRLALDRLCAEVADARPGDRRPDARVVVHPAADVRGSTLRGPLLVGPEAVVRDSYVGPYTCIAGGVHLVGAEIEYSVVLPGACIDHVGVRIEDSVIGAGARVNRTFARPTALRMHVGPGAHISFS